MDRHFETLILSGLSKEIHNGDRFRIISEQGGRAQVIKSSQPLLKWP